MFVGIFSWPHREWSVNVASVMTKVVALAQAMLLPLPSVH